MYNDKKIPSPLPISSGGLIPEGIIKDNKPANPDKVQEVRRYGEDKRRRLLSKLAAKMRMATEQWLKKHRSRVTGRLSQG